VVSVTGVKVGSSRSLSDSLRGSFMEQSEHNAFPGIIKECCYW